MKFSVKRLSLLCLALLLLCPFLPRAASAEILEVNGASYLITADGSATLNHWPDASGDVIIPAAVDGHPVTAIAPKVFYDAEHLTSVVLPEGITSIGRSAFAHCRALKACLLPQSLTTLEEAAFESCTSLASIEIPEGVRSLPDRAFSHSGLKTIKLPDTLTDMGAQVFFSSAVAEVGIGSGLISYSTAVGMMKSVVAVILFAGANWLSKKVRGESMF